MAGYAGTFLRINLSTGQIDKESLDMELAAKFIGGRGLASYILTQEVDPNVDALDPANKLIVATGPLSGSRAPTGVDAYRIRVVVAFRRETHTVVVTVIDRSK